MSTFSPSSIVNAAVGAPTVDSIYQIQPVNWFTALPYAFKWTSSSGVTSFIYLPLSPSNINITTHYATNVVTTLYGIVEEHSGIRYYDITLAGTTGYVPLYTGIATANFSVASPEDTLQTGPRDNFSNTGILDTLASAGFAQQTIGVIQQVTQQVQNVANLINGEDSNETGVDINATGYVAFHDLYRYFQLYKKDQANKSSSSVGGLLSSVASTLTGTQVHPLQFINYKDNNQYDIVPMTFSLIRSAESPMLYNYNITIRAFNLRTSTETVSVSADQFLTDIGLGTGGLGSLFNQIQGIAKGSMAVLGGVVSGSKVLGR